jgi:membrane protease YdiL (CAAX protease family)
MSALSHLPAFFLLVFALSVPFWLIGGATDLQLLPGLSVSALAGFAPMAAALVLVHFDTKSAGKLALPKRSTDFKRINDKGWLVPVLLLMPTISLVVYSMMRWMDMPLPAPELHVGPAVLMSIGFFVGGLGEELGWSGYATDPLQDRWSALRASLFLGAVGVIWHLIPLLLSHRALARIAWWWLSAFAARILTVWLYNNTEESVFAAALFHATLNLSWMLFPVYGSHFDVRLAALVMVCTTLIIIMWGSKTLAGRANV